MFLENEHSYRFDSLLTDIKRKFSKGIQTSEDFEALQEFLNLVDMGENFKFRQEDFDTICKVMNLPIGMLKLNNYLKGGFYYGKSI